MKYIRYYSKKQFGEQDSESYWDDSVKSFQCEASTLDGDDFDNSNVDGDNFDNSNVDDVYDELLDIFH